MCYNKIEKGRYPSLTKNEGEFTMKRILASILTLITVLMTLSGCALPKNASESGGLQKNICNAERPHSDIILTIAQTLPGCAAFEYKDEKPYCFYAYDTDGKLYRVFWNDFTDLNEKDVIVVDHDNDIKKLDYADFDGGFTPQYEVSAIGVKKEDGSDHLVRHIQIKSGDNTINPFGSLYYEKIDNGDGTFTELNVNDIDIKDKICVFADIIPKLVLNESVSYLVQANGIVENVILLTPTGDTYTSSQTTFEDLSDLPNGTYYVAFYVMLGGNCDSDEPQNSYGYQDIFCLIVDKNGLICDLPLYDSLLNLEVWGDKFVFQRIATTPCIVCSNVPIDDMSKGTIYEDRHDILTSFFRAMNGKEVVTNTFECDYLYYVYMFDAEDPDIPWHYRFAICDCGAVLITNNDEPLCSIMLDTQEIQSILSSLGLGSDR